MISPEQVAEIRRLFFAEHWKIGTRTVAWHGAQVLGREAADPLALKGAGG